MERTKFFSILILFLIGCKKENVVDYFKDERDGKIYKSVCIGNQIWMAENLRFDVSNVFTEVYPINNPNNPKIYFTDTINPNKPEIYGRFYDYNTALNACPAGWHLPSFEEWKTLKDYIGESEFRTAIKSTQDWTNNNSGSNASGFNAFPAGHFSSEFWNSTDAASFWTSTPEGDYSAYGINIFNDGTFSKATLARINGLSCRCIKD